MMIGRLALGGLLISLLGCYTYAPVRLESLTLGEKVRLHLSEGTASRIREAVGSDARVLEGELLAKEAGSLLLDVPVTTRQVGFRFETFNQRIQLGDSDIIVVERKELHRARTLGFSAAIAAVAGLAVYEAVSGKAGGDTQQQPPTGPSDIVVPFFSVRVP